MDGRREHEISRRVRIPGAQRLEEGFARKVLIPGRAGPAREIVLVRHRGKLRAFDSLCPHEGGRIAEGPLWDGRYLYCPLHLYRFDPLSGRAIGVDCPSARSYPVRETGDSVEVELPADDEVA
jgi:nitrite reductase/ring-hydroxylating ferredoxin subunit